MLRKIALSVGSLLIGFFILVVSIFDSASVNFSFSQAPTPSPDPAQVDVGYAFPYPGRIRPDSLLWPVKAIRDRLWLLVTFNPVKKAEVMLLFADKRLAFVQSLFESGKSDLAASTLTKAEKYLESALAQARLAQGQDIDTGEFLDKFAKASLKHRQTIEVILGVAPEDAKPMVIQTLDYPKKLFNEVKALLLSQGRIPPESPFDD